MKNINLIKRYSFVSLLAMLLFGFVFGNLLSRSMEQHMFMTTMHDISSIVNQNVIKHFKPSELNDPKTGKNYHSFSHKLGHLSLGNNIEKVKIWNRDMEIVWSERKDSVGQKADSEDEKQLLNAFNGETVTEYSDYKHKEHNYLSNVKADRLLELYVPILYEPEGDIETVFEVYLNLDPVFQNLSRHKNLVWLWTISGFSALYLVLFGGYWDASRRIKKQTKEILQSKQDWEETFNTITDMITIHDREFNILRANKAANQHFETSLFRDLKTKCYKHFHNLEEPPEWCPGIKCLKTGQQESAEMYDPHVNKFFDIRAIPRFDSNNELIGFIHDVRDISDIKEADEEKTKLQHQLLQVQKMDSIGRLAGGVAHDFNNIISVISGFSEIALREVEGNSVLKNHIQNIYDAGEKASALTSELLAFSRKQVLEMRALNLSSVISNMTNILKRLIGEDVIWEYTHDTPVHNVLGDKSQMEQVLLNLVINARDAMPGGGHLKIGLNNVDISREHFTDRDPLEPGEYVMLSVQDTGTGISEEVRDRIFEPFFSTKKVGKGTGLGLATVYGIIKQHGGQIIVDSDLGNGTEFKVYFPATEKEIERNESAAVKAATGTETVLIVDDEPLLLNLIAEMLEPLGYHVLGASGGKEALKLIDSFKGEIHLLLTDVIMPEMNGKQLADRLEIKRPGTKVIYMSGYTDDVIANHGVLDEGVVLVDKPIKGDVLAAKIREVLDEEERERNVMTSPHELSGLDILVVDDDRLNREIVQAFISDCKIETAENGGSAVEKFEAGKFDIILMDIQMPIMDGLTAVREMRKWEQENGERETAIIAMTGSSSREDIEECVNAGYTAHVAKPIKRDELMKTLIAHS